MRKILLLFAAFLFLIAPAANAAMSNFQTFTAEGANISIDALGIDDQTEGSVQAQIPTDAVVYAAYLYSADVWGYGLSDVVFEGNTMVSGPSSRLDVDLKGANSASENRWDVTTIVKPILEGAGGALTDFSVTELGSHPQLLDGEILAVLYSVPSAPVQTAFIFDGELATGGDQFRIFLGDGYDGEDAIFSLGISYSYQGGDQYTQVDVNGARLTTSAGGQDDGNSGNGGLITAGGLGDSTANPVDPNAVANGPRYDDELYNLASFLTLGETQITIDTLNPSSDDNVFFAALVVGGEGLSIPPDEEFPTNGVPEPATLLLLGSGLLGLAGFRSRFKK